MEVMMIMEEEEKEIAVNSINSAKNAIREIQEKLFVGKGEEIDPRSIFQITLKLNEYLDDIAVKINEEEKN